MQAQEDAETCALITAKHTQTPMNMVHVPNVDLTSFGINYVVEGPLNAPDGRAPYVRVIWFVETESSVPRLVTAYPLKGTGND